MDHARTFGEVARHAIPTLSCVLTHLTNPVHTQHRTDLGVRDGSKITGNRSQSPPARPETSLPVRRDRTRDGGGAMNGVTYNQRVNTKGGIASAMTCDAAGVSKKQTVPYSADYVFYGM